ncbi:hypothetical protein FUAX_48400 (plasmid) [Fulvitalea axinellae]|uniref:ABC transporter permease n=1 Tax=Fulvitalea axinellae TaxID=1182444 RepID=A0AAU9CWQ4_9BACT|nr:hypothetical protein FUAX_48400 [Fulvitalea axinellae]
MKRILKIEYRKLFHSRSFFILMGIYVLVFFIVTTNLSTAIVKVSDMGNQVDMDFGKYMGFPYIWQNMSYVAKFMKILPAIIVAMQVANEFTYGTFRQHVFNGMGRGEFLASKLALCVGLSLFAYVLVTGAALYVGLSKPDAATSIFEGYRYVPAFGFAMLGYFTFTMLLAFLTKNTALTLAGLLGYSWVAEPLIAWRMGDEFGRWLPLNVFERLNANPFLYKVGFPGSVPADVYGQDLLLGSVYILLFVGISFLYVKRADL